MACGKRRGVSEGGGLEKPQVMQVAGEKGEGGLWLLVRGVRHEKEARGSEWGASWRAFPDTGRSLTTLCL